MATPIIAVEHLSKSYRLRMASGARYVALRDVLTDRVGGLFKPRGRRPGTELFKALDDVSFTVEPGARLGIIGRNGAGKSTLLKVLSRITEPSGGRVVLEGRVASLLEVGTGFHPELSGRENIFLNGAILGMGRAEIAAKFDEIVAFAEVERFLDTPVKRYSSGMYVRLAFAVAAHLEPEILIVDEVLAVGDAEFQRKCLGKMQEISSGHGRTILFGSHNMGAIRNLCDRCLLLDRGQLRSDGPVEEVLPLYFGLTGRTDLQGFEVTATPDDPGGEWSVGSHMTIDIRWDRHRYPPGWHADIACYTMDGVKVFALQSHTLAGFDSRDPNACGVRFKVLNPGLADRELRLDVGVRPHEHAPYDVVIENALLLRPSDRGISHNRLSDVLLVPQASCLALTL
ncbi:MAG: ABC transporter ATP-binding protein [Flavobacteriales bacterium]|nr:ABC transporter ATP-binding protein [Flavobacteriales bacterium]